MGGRRRPRDVLKSVRELEKFRVVTADGACRGRIRDIYFDDQSWRIKHLIISVEPRQFGRKEVVVEPKSVLSFCEKRALVVLRLSAEELCTAPRTATVLPVCKQYASLALSSPGSRARNQQLTKADPNLRSVKTVSTYRVSLAGEDAGALADFIFEDDSWEIRYLLVEELLEQKKLRFHIVPQTVERFTWATERVLLRRLEPVTLEPTLVITPEVQAA